MQIRLLSTLTTCLVIMLASCTWKKEAYVPEGANTGPIADTCNTDIKYNPQVKRILGIYCANYGCHVPGGTGNGDYTTYAGIKAKIDNGTFYTRVLGPAHDMPSSFSTGPKVLSDCDFRKLKAWYDAGGPQ